MAIIPTIRCSAIKPAVTFYTTILDFELTESHDIPADPAFAVLRRGSDLLFLSSFGGDGEFGQAVNILVDDVDAVFRTLTSRGLKPPSRNSPVHQGPVDQSWGTRELYVDDPDGNTLRFIANFR